MRISEIKVEPLAVDVSVTADNLVLRLVDGRQVSVPLIWFPRLLEATPAQRANLRWIGKGVGVHRPLANEDISVASVLSAE